MRASEISVRSAGSTIYRLLFEEFSHDKFCRQEVRMPQPRTRLWRLAMTRSRGAAIRA